VTVVGRSIHAGAAASASKNINKIIFPGRLRLHIIGTDQKELVEIHLSALSRDTLLHSGSERPGRSPLPERRTLLMLCLKAGNIPLGQLTEKKSISIWIWWSWMGNHDSTNRVREVDKPKAFLSQALIMTVMKR
jgi:hypothetical protein